MALGVGPPLIRAPIGTKLAQSEASSPCCDDDIDAYYGCIHVFRNMHMNTYIYLSMYVYAYINY